MSCGCCPDRSFALPDKRRCRKVRTACADDLHIGGGLSRAVESGRLAFEVRAGSIYGTVSANEVERGGERT